MDVFLLVSFILGLAIGLSAGIYLEKKAWLSFSYDKKRQPRYCNGIYYYVISEENLKEKFVPKNGKCCDRNCFLRHWCD